MEMEDTRKRPNHQTGQGCAAKKPRDAELYGDEDEIAAWLCEDEYYTVGELMKLLGTEEAATSSTEMKVKFIENPHSWTMMTNQSSSSYVTINGNEESCGPSFSDAESSVMASIDTVGVKFGSGDAGPEVEGWLEKWTAEEAGAWGTIWEGASGSYGEEGEAVGKMEMNGGDWEADLLMRFIGEERSIDGRGSAE